MKKQKKKCCGNKAIKRVYNLFADFGDWLNKKSKDKDYAIILAILSLFSPLNLIFCLGFIASANRKKRKR